MRSIRSRPNARPTAAPRRPPGEPVARPSLRRPRPSEDLPLHALTARRLSLPESADLLGVCRRGPRSLRALGRLLDNTRAALALPAMGYIGHRPRSGSRAAGRALVRALALRPLVALAATYRD